MDRQDKRKVIGMCMLFLAALATASLFLLPYISRLSEPQYQSALREWVDRMGIPGLFAVLGLQMIQIVIAFIPGEPVELLAGVLYGTWAGLGICLLGCVLASAVIFSISRRFGKRFLYRIFGEEKVQGWRWLKDSTRVDLVVFILFFIPGTPKDMLTYIVGITGMSVPKFLLISTFARIPSILSSTLMGSAMSRGDWKVTLLVFVITGVTGIAGIVYRERILAFCRKWRSGNDASGSGKRGRRQR